MLFKTLSFEPPLSNVVFLQFHHDAVATTSVQSVESMVSVGPPLPTPVDAAAFTVQHENPLHVVSAPVYVVVDDGIASSLQQAPQAPYLGLPSPSAPRKPAPMVLP